MLYRQFNKTGINLSILGFGCMRLPTIDNKPEKIDYPKATRLLHYAIAHGVNYVDTAYFYHAAVFGQPGKSEPFLGEALSGGWRKKYIPDQNALETGYQRAKLLVEIEKKIELIEKKMKKNKVEIPEDLLDPVKEKLENDSGLSWDDNNRFTFIIKNNPESHGRFLTFLTDCPHRFTTVVLFSVGIH
jgi:hypothetical protein